MYYEPYQNKKKRRPRRRRKSFGGWLAEFCLRLIALLLALMLLSVGVLYALPVSLWAVEPEDVDLSLTDGLPASRANILLLGLDAVRETHRRSDSVIIASVGYGALNLTSVLRDTLVDIPGRGQGKLNAAYAYGGPELVMKTLNQNFGLNLMHYVAVDFRGLVAVVDALGGVELNLTEAEMNKINRDLDAARSKLEPLGYTAPALTHSGEDTRLNGLQALAYARIRKLDSDFVRASRQRALLEAMLRKLKANLWNPALLIRVGKALLTVPETNLSWPALLSLGEKALAAGTPRQMRLPIDGTYTDDGSSLRIDDLPANIAAFRDFAYQ